MSFTTRSLPRLACATLVALLAACGSTTDLSESSAKVPVETRNPVPVTAQQQAAGAATPGATPQSRVTTVDLAAQNAARASAAAAAAAASAQRIIYFDFDSFVIKDEFKPVIDSHARALAANRGQHIVIEGHTDERGGSEYNLALGQKRAEAVAKALELLGAGDKQVEAVSFGKERPVDTGHDEAAWAKNRRAELKDR